MKKTSDELLELARAALERAGADARMAAAAARHLVSAEAQIHCVTRTISLQPKSRITKLQGFDPREPGGGVVSVRSKLERR